MKIEPKSITVRDLTDAYEDNEELGVRAFGGKLDVRPPYQREFVYKDKQREAVIATLRKDFPLNVMYWSVRSPEASVDGVEYEIIDGQQRTISICQFVDSEFSFEGRYFHNLHKDEQEQVLNYPLTVYLCSGADSERLEWFRTINIAGEELTQQELRNAVYAGSWVMDAKRYFSRTGCAAVGLGGDYMRGSPIRQEYLETVIKWISNGDVEGYMAKQQHQPNATDLWLYFQNVMTWVKTTFPKYRREMKAVDWGRLYNQYKDTPLDPDKLEAQITALMADEDVTKKRGIYIYVLNGEERNLSIRGFTDNQKREAYERQEGICPVCGDHFDLIEMEADHITPWHAGGKTIAANCKLLCKEDNRRKSGV